MKSTFVTTPRTATLSRLVLSLVVAMLLGAMLMPSVEASKPGKNTIGSIKSRVKRGQELCEFDGGTWTVKNSPFVPNKIGTCEGSNSDFKCVYTPKKTICTTVLTPDEDVPTPPGETGVLYDPTGGGSIVSPPNGGQVAAQGETNRKHHRHGAKARKK